MSNLCATPLQCWNQTEECVVLLIKELYISYRPTRVVTRSCVGLYNEEQALTTATVCAVETEHGDSTPLVLSEIGVRGPRLLWPSKTIKFMSQKYGQSYSSILFYIRCRIIFNLIHSAEACLRSPRSSFHAPAREINLNNHLLDLIHSKVHPFDIDSTFPWQCIINPLATS